MQEAVAALGVRVQSGMYTGLQGEAWVPVGGNPSPGVRFNVPCPFPTGPGWLSQSEPA